MAVKKLERRDSMDSMGMDENKSLILRAKRYAGEASDADSDLTGEKTKEEEEPVRLEDGYLRRSPVQRYCIEEGYYRKTAIKAVLIAVGVLLVGMLVFTILRSGIFKLAI